MKRVCLVGLFCTVLICAIVAGCAVPESPVETPSDTNASVETTPMPTEPEASEEISILWAWTDSQSADGISIENGSVKVLRKESSVDTFIADHFCADNAYRETLESYGEEFFEKKTLVLVFFEGNINDHFYQLADIRRQADGDYTVDVDHSETQGVSCIVMDTLYVLRLEVNGIIPEDASMHLNVMELPAGYRRTKNFNWSVYSDTANRNSDVYNDLLTSKGNLDAFRNSVLARDSDNYRLLGKHDSDFFQSNALAIFYFCPGSGGRQYVVTDVFLTGDGDCLIYMDCLLPMEESNAPECYLVCIEINEKVEHDAKIYYEVTEK